MILHPRLLFSPILLRSLLAIVDEGGFSRAAKRLSMQQSTVSQHLMRLEEQLGTKLIERHASRVIFTPAGQRIEQSAREILSLYARLANEVGGRELEGQVRIGSPEEFAVFRLPNILSAFRKVHPRVDLEVHVAPSTDLLEMFDSERLDVAIFERKPGDRRGTLIRHEPLYWYGSGASWPATDESLPLILYPEGSPVRDVITAACADNGRAWRATGSSASYLGMRAAVLAGAGITAFGASSKPVTVETAPAAIGLPRLPGIELALEAHSTDATAAELVDAILSAERHERPPLQS
ncbi:LysR family transcriptional regulator [Sphingopyxis sp.]|uniref:LysR family transcriptional regulator n=1 Tax=Sphingopyxis sp. TaxID=1908224 RepID=UPI003D6D801F